ncbi:response regulator [Pseudomonas sp. ITEM 17296]|uniref:response regulator n=1 Tax=Pseudomonas sp. ITEM 17296 TaxID=2790281 RepID=UPI0023807E73|nr:response regulator [Pseudomonas sp. ITEM 17296]MDE4539267.1 response regulator [Pseudomonas sp. ITEM 17296]
MKLDVEGLSLSGKTILVVEDDETLRTLLVDILVELGADYAAFDNAEDALIHLLDTGCDCALMVVDHGVPGTIKGMELISLAHEKWPGLPAILTSGYQLDASEVTPPVTYLFKPWSIAELSIAIKHALDGQTQSPANPP